MKKWSWMLSLLLISGCTADRTAEPTVAGTEMLEVSTYLDEFDEIKINQPAVHASFVEGYDDMDLRYEESSDIVLAGIVSLDGAEGSLPDGRKSILGFSYGTLVVYDVLKGTMETGEIYDYAREGAIMTQEQFDQLRSKSSLEKAEMLREENGFDEDLSTSYANTYIKGDVMIEPGKTYLLYLQADETHDVYTIIGSMYGMREVSLPKQDTLTTVLSEETMQELQIRDNITGEFESYEDYLNRHIRNHEE